MVEIQDLRRQVLKALAALEKKKSALVMEKLDLENRADDAIIGLANNMYMWVVLSSIIAYLQSKFVGESIWLMFSVVLVLAVGWGNAFIMAKRKIRWMTGSMEDLKRKKTSLIEDAEQLVIELQKSQKACQSKVKPVMEEDFPANNGDDVANISFNTDWLSRQEFFEKRFERVRIWNNCGDFERDRMSFIKGIAIIATLLLSCFAMASYYFYGAYWTSHSKSFCLEHGFMMIGMEALISSLACVFLYYK